MSFISPGFNPHRGFNILWGDLGVHVCGNGPAWANSVLPLLTYQSAAFGNGVYVIGANSVGAARNTAVSADGATFALSTTTSNLNTGNVERIVFGNGVFLDSSASSARFNSSPDGNVWTDEPALNAAVQFQDFVFGNGLFVVADSSSANTYATTGAGGAWTIRATPVQFSGLAWSSVRGKWFASELGGLRTYSSPDLIAWTQLGNLPLIPSSGIRAGADGSLVAPKGIAQAFIAVSLDGGATWADKALPFATLLPPVDVVYSNGAWITIQNGAFVSVSVDALTWTAAVSQITSQGAIPWRLAVGPKYIAVPVLGGGSTVGALGIC